MTLLELDSPGVSLEFSHAEWPAILTALRATGRVKRLSEGIFDLIRVNDSDLLLYDEWDEPCLLSNDVGGSALLRWLAGAPSLAIETKDAA